MPYPVIDDTLAAEVLEAAGATPDDDVETVVTRLRSWLPAGSTAKWAAVDRGERPPGADPSTALVSRLNGELQSWACWPLCTGIGALLAARGHDVRLAVEHMRTGANSPPVDFHSVLVVDGCLVDPFLGPSAPIPPGHDVIRPDGWAAWVPGDRPDHLGARGGSSVFRYRQLGDHLDARDVRAFCDISVTHTGVGRRRTAHWLRGNQLWFVREIDGPDGGQTIGVHEAELRVTDGVDPFQLRRRVVETGSFEALVDRIAA